MAKNTNLNKAKAAKDDEFYTSLSDVEKEMMHYPDAFRGKHVLCNCDDPEWSAFWRYFSLNFDRLGLRRLSSTHYVKDGVSYRLDMTAQGQQTLPIPLDGNGDFRSPECLELLDECDIVVTNPPFSLFREYIATLMEHGKQFIVLGNMNALKYKEIFPLIRDGRIWLGTCNGTKTYKRPDGTEQKLGNTSWYTNVDYDRRHERMVLWRTYEGHEADYPRYDNYDAINVDKTCDIPCDYMGAMGVPISYLDKHCPEQFELLEHLGAPVLEDGKKLYSRLIIRRIPGSRCD